MFPSHSVPHCLRSVVFPSSGAGSERVRGSQGPSEGGGLHVQMKPEGKSSWQWRLLCVGRNGREGFFYCRESAEQGEGGGRRNEGTCVWGTWTQEFKRYYQTDLEGEFTVLRRNRFFNHVAFVFPLIIHELGGLFKTAWSMFFVQTVTNHWLDVFSCVSDSAVYMTSSLEGTPTFEVMFIQRTFSVSSFYLMSLLDMLS